MSKYTEPEDIIFTRQGLFDFFNKTAGKTVTVTFEDGSYRISDVVGINLTDSGWNNALVLRNGEDVLIDDDGEVWVNDTDAKGLMIPKYVVSIEVHHVQTDLEILYTRKATP